MPRFVQGVGCSGAVAGAKGAAEMELDTGASWLHRQMLTRFPGTYGVFVIFKINTFFLMEKEVVDIFLLKYCRR